MFLTPAVAEHYKPQNTHRKKSGKISDPRPTPKLATSASAAAHNSPFCARCDLPPKAPKANQKSRTCTLWCPYVPVSRPKKCPWGAKQHASAATFHSQYSRANDSLGLGLRVDGRKSAKTHAVANWRRKPSFWAVSGASAKSGSRRKSILGRSSGVCVQVSLGRSVGMGLLRAPVMPKQAFLASETILGPCRCNVAEIHVFDPSSRRAL